MDNVKRNIAAILSPVASDGVIAGAKTIEIANVLASLLDKAEERVQKMKASYHYITLDRNKLLKQIEEKEQEAIKDSELEIARLALLHQHGSNLPIPKEFLSSKLPTIEDILEEVIIKSNDHLISVYPMVPHFKHDEATWVRFDKRSAIYRYGWLLVLHNDVHNIKKAGLLIELYVKGDLIASEELYDDELPSGYMDAKMSDVLSAQMLQSISQLDVIQKVSNFCLDVPMFVSQKWMDVWEVEKKSQFTTFYT